MDLEETYKGCIWSSLPFFTATLNHSLIYVLTSKSLSKFPTLTGFEVHFTSSPNKVKMRLTSLIISIVLFASTNAFQDGIDVEFELFLGPDNTFIPVIVASFPLDRAQEINNTVFRNGFIDNVKSVLVVRSTGGKRYLGEECNFWNGDSIVAEGVGNDKVIIGGINLGETVSMVNCTG